MYEDHCVIPYPVVGMYAVALALLSGAHEIFLVGFDGYMGRNVRVPGLYRSEQVQADREMEEFVEILLNEPSIASGSVRIRSLTPTAYDIEAGSLYNYI